MAVVKIRGQSVNIDIREEIEEFNWERARWSSDKLIAASPFRFDKSPSFFVHLEGEYAGFFGDSGYIDEEWRSGNLVKLLAFLRNETYEESLEYLLLKYGVAYSSESTKLVLPTLRTSQTYNALPESIVTALESPYLTKRGISAEVQTQAGVGKSKHPYFVAIPWRQADGRLANVKYRSTRGKTFFYETGATPIGQLVYGANLYVKSSEDLVICEAEIDALSWRTAGYNAVAVGGVAFSKVQEGILRRLPFKRLLLAGDNDAQGQSFNKRIYKAMNGRDMALVTLEGAKDANEALVKFGASQLMESIQNATQIKNLSINLKL